METTTYLCGLPYQNGTIELRTSIITIFGGLLTIVLSIAALFIAFKTMKNQNQIAQDNDKQSRKTHRCICKMYYYMSSIQSISLEQMKLVMTLQVDVPKNQQDQDNLLDTLTKLQDKRIKAMESLNNCFLESQEE